MNKEQEPVAWMRKWAFDGEVPTKMKNDAGQWHWPAKFKLKPITENQCLSDDVPLYTTPPQRTKVVFPTMLRKMWSGGEVQAWLDENVNKENT